MLLIVATTILQYVFCAFVTPEIPAEGKIDLVAFHQCEYRRYVLAAVALFGLAVILNLALRGTNYYADWWRDSVFSIVGVALGLLAFFFRAHWAQIVSAATIAALLTHYLIITSNVVASQLCNAAFGAGRPAACRDCKRHTNLNPDKRRADCTPPLIAHVRRTDMKRRCVMQRGGPSDTASE